MIGTREIQPVGRKIPNLFRTVTIRFSEPMWFSAAEPGPLYLRQATDQIMYTLRELSGQDYVNRYAKRGEAPGEAEVSHPRSVVELERPDTPALVG
jgi:1-acyl-sn-glycerol-3-phosphate acyltransferase